MKRIFSPLIAVVAFWGPAAHAQATIDVNKVTCADYLAMPADMSRDFSAWMSGWINQKTNDVKLNLEGYARNVASVKSWCSSSPNDTVMAGLQRAEPRAAQGVGGPVDIDLSTMTCKQFIESDDDRKTFVHSWLSGYVSASRNLSTVDMRYVRRNANVISRYCKTHRNVTIMSAIQKKAK